jgi:toxin YoeB
MFIKVAALIEETSRTPFHGKGQPEQLKHQLTGYWSRRINEEHRLVYSVSEDNIEIISCKYHY